jgi:hypothetical protein
MNRFRRYLAIDVRRGDGLNSTPSAKFWAVVAKVGSGGMNSGSRRQGRTARRGFRKRFLAIDD